MTPSSRRVATPATPATSCEPIACDAILLAAGQGRRLAQGRPKALAQLGGRPLFSWSLRTLRAEERIERIVLVVPLEADAREEILNELAWLERNLFPGGRRPVVDLVVEGGERRQDSVSAGLRTLREIGAEDDRVVLVHDAARPFLSSALVRRCLGAFAGAAPDSTSPASRFDLDGGPLDREGSVQERLPGMASFSPWGAGPAGVVPGLPVRETLKLVQADRVLLTQPREHLYSVQTPQAFRLGALEMVHRRAREVGFTGTDDAALLEWQGIPVRLVEGEELNLKVTFPRDLVIAEQLLPLHGGD